MKAVLTGRLQPKQLITHDFDLHEIARAYDTFSDASKNRALKVIINNGG
jgi:alcohol dehydrogenase